MRPVVIEKRGEKYGAEAYCRKAGAVIVLFKRGNGHFHRSDEQAEVAGKALCKRSAPAYGLHRCPRGCDYPAEKGELTVLYEDDHLLAVDKPAGMLIHPSRATMTGTLANRVLGYYQETNQGSAFHPVTRLDRDTYGVVLLAKNAHIHALCNDLHTQGLLKKTYHALTFGCPETDSGRIDAPIARKPLPSLLRYVAPEGKPSVTEFSVLEKREHTAVLSLRPITGRTHQLRVHCAYMGFPIVGDPQYFTQESMAFSQKLGIKTQLLCAKTLTFPHPVTGEALEICSRLSVSILPQQDRR